MFSECIGGIKVIQLFVRHKKVSDDFNKINHENYLAGMSQIKVYGLFMPFIDMLSSITLAVVIFYGGGRVVAEALSLGTLIAFISYTKMFFRPLRDNPLGGLIASIGFLLILQTTAVMGFGVRMAHIKPPTQAKFELIEGVVLTHQRLFVILAAVLLLGALYVFLRKTRFGWAMRACAQDREAAALQGISLSQVSRIAMFIGAALAGVAGALTAPLVSPSPYMGHSVIVTAFIIIIVGGIGQLEGAVVAAVLYAFVHTFVTTFFDGVVADITGLMLMLLVLVIKPTGLFGTRERV